MWTTFLVFQCCVSLICSLEVALVIYDFVAGDEEIQNTSLLCRDDKAGLGQKQMDYEDVALISLDSMERANSTLEDFVSIL